MNNIFGAFNPMLGALGLDNEMDAAKTVAQKGFGKLRNFQKKLRNNLKQGAINAAQSGTLGSGLGLISQFLPNQEENLEIGTFSGNPDYSMYGQSPIARVGHSLPKEGILAGSRRLSPYTQKKGTRGKMKGTSWEEGGTKGTKTISAEEAKAIKDSGADNWSSPTKPGPRISFDRER